MAVSGYIGSAGNNTFFETPQSLNITLPANTYPSGTITFDSISSSGAYWRNNFSNAQQVNIYLCDSAGNNRVLLFQLSINGSSSDVTTKTATISGASALEGKALYLLATGANYAICLRNRSTVTLNTASSTFSITCNAGTGGSLKANVKNATPGTTIKLTPTPDTGYELSGYTTSPSVSISNNKFTMPSSNVTVTASFSKISYSITKKSSPSGGGTVTTSANSATMGTQITVSQTTNSGYYFDGYTTSPSVTISSNKFSMPASNITVTGKYLKLSTATLSSKTLTGGSSVTLNINADKSSYSHQYKVRFADFETNWTTVAAGTSTVTISVPINWCNYLPNATQETGGELELRTYNGDTRIGTTTVTGLKYVVPSSVKPSIGTINTSIERTISGTTYADVGSYYVQNHCGVAISTTASGDHNSTITSIQLSISGYSGNKYNKTVSTSSISFTTGLLSIAGTNTITITATDSRGRTATKTKTITVTAYSAPAGTLRVWRTDENDDEDPMGTYGCYEMTASYTAVGSNSMTKTLRTQSTNATPEQNTGRLLPGDRKTFNLQQQYEVKLTLQDAFETTTITVALHSASFIMYVNPDGTKLSFMKAANKTIPTGKNSTIEFSGDSQIYIGDETLEEFIQRIAGS